MISRFTDILQKNITIQSNNKIIRQGKLLMITQKDFYITFIMSIKGLTKKYEIPYPFDIIKSPNQIIFDYKVSKICSNDTAASMVLGLAKSMTPNKFFNNTIEINLS